MLEDNDPAYVISVAAQILKMHPQSLRYYERAGLVRPSRSRGNIRLYSQKDIQQIQLIQRLINDLGVNLAGVEVILNMTEQMDQMEKEMAEMRQAYEAEIQRLRGILARFGVVLEPQLPAARPAVITNPLTGE